MSSSHLRNRFTDGALTTASPRQVVVMAYDRIDRDLAGATEAIEAADVARAHELLCHAQDLVSELLGMLDLDAWEHAPKLAAIYRFVIELLTTANVTKRTSEVLAARGLLAELGDAFRTAATTVGGASAAPPPATAAGAADAPPSTGEHRLSLRA